MKNTSIKICNATVHPGEKATLALPLPEQYSCTPMYMPIKAINGHKPGPCLLVFSILKGDEFNGLEIANQLFDLIDPHQLKGSLITIPALNIYGLTHYPQTTPTTDNIENSFPGNKHGNFCERIAYVFTEEILKKADFCIELQTGSLNHEILPQVYCDFDDQNSRKLAHAFQTPVIIEVDTALSKIRETTQELHIPLLVYEAGEAMRFDHNAIQIGVEGIQNVMRKLEMLEGSVDYRVTSAFAKDERWITASASGILHTYVSLGEFIKKGSKICKLSDPFSNENATEIKSHIDGIIVGINKTPLIQEGVSIFKIASFVDNAKAEAMLEKWEDQQPSDE